MGDWASRKAAEDSARLHDSIVLAERENRDNLVLDEEGYVLFEDLFTYLSEQVVSYNEKMGAEVLGVRALPGRVNVSKKVELFRLDHAEDPLLLTYYPASHCIKAGSQEFTLRRGLDGRCRFEDASRRAYTVEELGERLLNGWSRGVTT